jgi:hypothetical protein
LLADDRVFLRLLRSALSERQSQGLGDLAVHSAPDLPWERLAEQSGGLDALVARVGEVAARTDRDQLDRRTRLALETAERYASGEQPNRDFFGRLR